MKPKIVNPQPRTDASPIDLAEDVRNGIVGARWADARAVSAGTRLMAYYDSQMDAIETRAEAQDRDILASERRDHDKLAEARRQVAEAVAKTEGEITFRNQQLANPGRGRETDGATWANGSPQAADHGDDVRAWASAAADRITRAASGADLSVRAALTSGGIDVPSIITPVVQQPAGDPRRILQLLIDRRQVGGNEFAYLRQVLRSSSAAVVADGGTKPTSTYSFEDESDRLRVFAHLSEPIPERYLEDHAELVRIIGNQMGEDVIRKVESEALTGDGTGERFRGILNTSGIQIEPFDTDAFTTMRGALTKMLLSGEAPNAWVLNHLDMAKFDMTRENGTTGAFLGGLDERVFGRLPVVGTTLVPQGTAVLADWSQARLIVRNQGLNVKADASGELFNKNQVKLRVEGRFGFAVLRPMSFIKVELEDGQ